MNTLNRFLLAPTILAAGILFLTIGLAQADVDISFPVAELGNCESKTACFAYCELEENQDACYAFAIENNLIDEEDAETYDEIHDALSNNEGPGGCDSQVSCDAHCSNINNIQECIAFAEEHDLMSEEELEEAEQIKTALESGATLPGGCSNENECETYCEDSAHMQECFAFAKAAGFVDEEEIEEMERVMEIMESGNSPGGCTSKNSCEAYCDDESHFEECITFAETAGFMTSEEAENARSHGSFGGPGGCKGESDCDTFCREPENREECMEFAIASGHMTEEEAEMMMTKGFEGPGGCVGEDECMEFCSNPDNQETCSAFGEEHGMQSDEFEDRGEYNDYDEYDKYNDHEDYDEYDEYGEYKDYDDNNDHGTYDEYKDTDSLLEFTGPGGCQTESECMDYCSLSENWSECESLMDKNEMHSDTYDDSDDDHDDNSSSSDNHDSDGEESDEHEEETVGSHRPMTSSESLYKDMSAEGYADDLPQLEDDGLVDDVLSNYDDKSLFYIDEDLELHNNTYNTYDDDNDTGHSDDFYDEKYELEDDGEHESKSEEDKHSDEDNEPLSLEPQATLASSTQSFFNQIKSRVESILSQ